MNITSAQYYKSPLDNPNNDNTAVKATIDGETMWIPLDTSNRHYEAILEWVADGNTIQDAS